MDSGGWNPWLKFICISVYSRLSISQKSDWILYRRNKLYNIFCFHWWLVVLIFSSLQSTIQTVSGSHRSTLHIVCTFFFFRRSKYQLVTLQESTPNLTAWRVCVLVGCLLFLYIVVYLTIFWVVISCKTWNFITQNTKQDVCYFSSVSDQYCNASHLFFMIRSDLFHEKNKITNF